jgi:glycosyltransferase involved in cell wall biosynthesis
LFREKPSVIHFTEPNLWSGILLPFLHELPVVTTVHDVHSHLGSRSLDHDFAQKLHVFFSDRLIVHGEKSREELKQNYKCDIIPHGDYSFFARLRSDEPSEEEGAVLFFGRIEPYKGLKYLIEATHIVSQKLPNVKLIIAGSGDISRYEGLIVDKRVIEMHNRYIPDSEVPIFFRRASIVVLPYIEATQSGIIPIAYAFGKPVIASRVGDIPDVIESEKTGILVESGNSKVLANAMIRLLTNEQLRNEMGFNARRKMETELSWRIIAGRTVEVYRKAMNRKNKK